MIAEKLGQYHEETDEGNALAYLSELFGNDIRLQHRDQLSLSLQHQLQLEDGLVVMQSEAAQGPIRIVYKTRNNDRYLTAEVDAMTEQHVRATAILLKQYLNASQQDYTERLDQLRPHFGYSIRSVTKDELRIDADQRHRLLRGDVVLLLDNAVAARSNVNVLVLLGDGKTVLLMGPIRFFDQYPQVMLILIAVLCAITIALSVYLQLRPIQRRLRRLDREVRRLGSGDLDAYADMEGSDAIGQLAATFNGMTTHIRRLVESQREMTRAVSHELRTPVARLRFGLEMLADIEDTGQRREKLNALDRDIEELDKLIDEILTYARLEQGTPDIHFVEVDVYEVCQRLIVELDELRGETVLKLSGSALIIEAEFRYVHRVMQNLVTNALRYARSEVSMSVEKAGQYAILRVDDDGPGIPDHERERVFKPFARLDKSRGRASGGYGLGLSIVRRIIEWHGGQISVYQSPRGGARFEVKLPCRQGNGHVLMPRR